MGARYGVPVVYMTSCLTCVYNGREDAYVRVHLVEKGT